MNAPVRFYLLAAVALFAAFFAAFFFGVPTLAGALFVVVVLLLVASEVLFRIEQLDASMSEHRQMVRRLLDNARNRKELQP